MEKINNINYVLVHEAFERDGWTMYHYFMRGNKWVKGNDTVTCFRGGYKLNGEPLSNERFAEMLHIVSTNPFRVIKKNRTIALVNLHVMKKGIALFVLLLVVAAMSTRVFAQKVYSCQYKSDADVKVYVSQYKSDADLVVYETKYKSEATDNSGIWYFCEYKSDADRKIYFCDYKSDADIIIYFSKYKSDAGWKKNAKKHLMYKKN